MMDIKKIKFQREPLGIYFAFDVENPEYYGLGTNRMEALGNFVSVYMPDIKLSLTTQRSEGNWVAYCSEVKNPATGKNIFDAIGNFVFNNQKPSGVQVNLEYSITRNHLVSK